MFSNSASSFGGNSSRAGSAPYGQLQPHSQQQQQSQYQPQGGVGAQATGFMAMPLQNQFTRFQGQGQSSTGTLAPSQLAYSPGYTQTSQQQIAPNSTMGLQLQSGQSQGHQMPMRTGQTSSEIAQSFQASEIPLSKTPKATPGTKIPSIRLSFLTAQDQARFEQLFKSAVGDKVRDLLVRSKLPGSDLMQIWMLSDTTKSGQLLFPEFALAMYLCNLRIVGKELPRTLADHIANEVSSMVDIISFGVPDDEHASAPPSNRPSAQTPMDSPGIRQPQPQASNSQLLGQLTAQPTGFASQYIPPQPTGLQQATSYAANTSNYQQQQPTSYVGHRPLVPTIPAGSSVAFLQPGNVSAPLPLNAQPTGRPGEWGLVNSPATGLPNIDALQQRMMPQAGREGAFSTAGLSGSATIPWAVTKEEKRIYDQLFKAWDGLNRGFIGGGTAIEMMSQSGLDKSDLEKIWTLADPDDKGRLDMDEFAVAMHLLYRKLNGYPVPNRLPPELVPPSTRNFADSIGTVKNLLSQDAETRKNSGTFLQPQRTGVSYLKTHSFRSQTNGTGGNRKDATVFRNNDDEVSYKSSARRRTGTGGRATSPAQPALQSSETSNEDLSVEQLRKKVREKQILLDAMDLKDETSATEDDLLDRKDRREADELYHRIRRLQEDIDSHPSASLRSFDSGAERRTMQRHLQGLVDKLPELASHMRKTERDIAETNLELFRLKDSRVHPKSGSAVIGTGPGGTVTEADRLKARAKAMMQQRSAALTGLGAAQIVENDEHAATQRLEAQNSEIRTEKENNERMIRDVEDGVRQFSRSLEDNLKQNGSDTSTEHERRRWEDGLGVEDEVKDFIFDLQRASRTVKIRKEELRGLEDGTRRDAPSQDPKRLAMSSYNSKYDAQPAASPAPETSSSSVYKTVDERAAFIKQQAEQRMAERFAALGIKPISKSGESLQQKQDRESREREERLRQAEAEDAKRDQERRRRIAEEQPTPPITVGARVSAKKPPPPPARKSRGDSVSHHQGEARRVSDDHVSNKEKVLRDQQQVLEKETKEIEGETKKQEKDYRKEREAAEARLRALEDQYKAGKLKKQEEKRRKQATEKEASDRAERLTVQQAELAAAKEREQKLQLQLESLNDVNLSDDEDALSAVANVENEAVPSLSIESQQVTEEQPKVLSTADDNSNPSHKLAELPKSPSTTQLSSSYSIETKNPFFKQLSRSVDNTTNSTPSTNITSPAVKEASTNPFHRLTQQDSASTSTAQLSATPTGNRPSRVRPEDDDWSAVDSNGGSSDGDDDDDERPTGGSAKQLASMLFGTMGPPRPQSAMGDNKSPSTTPALLNSAEAPEPAFSRLASDHDTPAGKQYVGSPRASPSTPSMLGSFDNAPSAAPPPPPLPLSGSNTNPPRAPLMPNSSTVLGVPPPPPPPPPPPNTGGPAVGALLGEIHKGKGLRKVETKDRSQASVAGRVLG